MRSVLTIERLGEHDGGICRCCGDRTRSVSGFVKANGITRAAYNVRWTINRVFEHGAHWDIIIGDWDEGSSAAGRYNVRLDYRVTDSGPAFMVIDGKTAPAGISKFSSRALTREEVIGTAIATEVFAICDAAMEQDERLTQLVV